MYLAYLRRVPDGLERPFADRAREIASELDSPRLRFYGLVVASLVNSKSGRFEENLHLLREAEPSLGDLPIRERWIYRSSIIWSLIQLGHTREARDEARTELSRVSHPAVAPTQYRMLCECLGLALMSLGEWNDLDVLIAEVCDETLPSIRRGVQSWPTMLLQTYGQQINAARGRPVDPGLVDHAVEFWGGRWDSTRPNWIPPHVADLYTADKDLDRVRRLLEGAWSLDPPARFGEHLPFAVLSALRAETHLVDPQDKPALDKSAQYVDHVMRAAQHLARQGPRGEAWWLEARAHAARAHGADTPAAWATAASAWGVCEHLPDVARCRHLQGVALLAAGDREAAQTSLREALEIAIALDAAPLVEEISILARRARLPIQEAIDVLSAPTRTFGLTAREQEVLHLVAEGMSNAQIAHTLFMSPKTASVHVSRILMKLGVANRTEAATTARRQGLIEL